MRIAISGSHCCGKSTLIEEFLLVNPGFIHEPEPYTTLQEDYGESFADPPALLDFHRQLTFNSERLGSYCRGQDVIFERSPVDFVAYMMALVSLGREHNHGRLIEQSLILAKEAIQCLDVLMFVRTNDRDYGAVDESEDPELRNEVDRRLEAIILDDEIDLLATGPVVVEGIGSTTQRLETLNRALRTNSIARS